MSTFLFDQIIFGPIKSRRLGSSLGINLLPTEKKVCNFNCIYCECGWTEPSDIKSSLPSVQVVKEQLEIKLKELKDSNSKLDVITFAGNGEPTMHPGFSEIIDNTIALRNQYFPSTKVAVLSNSTLIHKKNVFDALQRVDQNILKLDSGVEATCKALNKPVGQFSLKRLVDGLKKFKGNVIIQTLFMKGNYESIHIDNTTDEEVKKWLGIIEEVKPKQVMLYSLARDTPASGLEKVSGKVLKGIAQKVEALGIPVQIAE